MRNPFAKGGRPRRVLDWTVNLVLFGLVVYTLLKPGGLLSGVVDDWSEKRLVEAEWVNLMAEGARLGTAPADTRGEGPVVVEFGDYECPACREAHSAVESLLQTSPDVQFVYLHLPLEAIHSSAAPAARAAICAQAQSAFSQMHDYLYESVSWLDPDQRSWLRIAEEVGVRSPERLVECMDLPATQDRLDRDLELARRLGLTATPSFVSRTSIHVGVPRQELWSEFLGSSR